MSALALTANRTVADSRARAEGDFCAAHCPYGRPCSPMSSRSPRLPTLVADSHRRSARLVTRGALILAFRVRAHGQPRRRDQTEPLPGAADHAGRGRPDGQHPQRVRAVGRRFGHAASSPSRRSLWLLTPWWGRSDFALLRAHLTCLARRARHRCLGRRHYSRPGVAHSPTVAGLSGAIVADTCHAGGPLRGRPAPGAPSCCGSLEPVRGRTALLDAFRGWERRWLAPTRGPRSLP